jgi:hypothetical protein
MTVEWAVSCLSLAQTTRAREHGNCRASTTQCKCCRPILAWSVSGGGEGGGSQDGSEFKMAL